MIFKVDNDLNFVAYDRATWDRFPDPYSTFQIIVDASRYTTSKRKLASRCTSFGKIYDQNGRRITHRDFSGRHGLQIGQEFEVIEMTPFETYRVKTVS